MTLKTKQQISRKMRKKGVFKICVGGVKKVIKKKKKRVLLKSRLTNSFKFNKGLHV